MVTSESQGESDRGNNELDKIQMVVHVDQGTGKDMIDRENSLCEVMNV